MDVSLNANQLVLSGSQIDLPLSKSVLNRQLLIHALAGRLPDLKEDPRLPEDSNILHRSLPQTNGAIDIELAGTAMRFLSAYYAQTDGASVLLTGNERMQQRPLGILVDALIQLGGTINYEGRRGYPPIQINGRKLKGGELEIDGSVSSQYISALLMIAPRMEHGLKLHLKGKLVSKPYIQMTLALMKSFGVKSTWVNETIVVQNQKYKVNGTFAIELDWSAASYFYSVVALSPIGFTLYLNGLKMKSVQGDSVCVQLFEKLGVETEETPMGLKIEKTQSPQKSKGFIDCSNFPDLAQTLACTYAGLNIPVELEGLSTLRIKETDRIEALVEQLTKLGAEVSDEEDTLVIQKGITSKKQSVLLEHYGDHRMAMAFAPIATLGLELSWKNGEVVEKSFPHFWEEIKS